MNLKYVPGPDARVAASKSETHWIHDILNPIRYCRTPAVASPGTCALCVYTGFRDMAYMVLGRSFNCSMCPLFLRHGVNCTDYSSPYARYERNKSVETAEAMVKALYEIRWPPKTPEVDCEGTLLKKGDLISITMPSLERNKRVITSSFSTVYGIFDHLEESTYTGTTVFAQWESRNVGGEGLPGTLGWAPHVSAAGPVTVKLVCRLPKKGEARVKTE